MSIVICDLFFLASQFGAPYCQFCTKPNFFINNPSVSIPYNTSSVNGSGRFMLVMYFENKKVIKVAITNYACDCRVSLQWLKQDSNRMRVKCTNDGCLWYTHTRIIYVKALFCTKLTIRSPKL